MAGLTWLGRSCFDMFEEFGAAEVEAFLQACRQLADDILYLLAAAC